MHNSISSLRSRHGGNPLSVRVCSLEANFCTMTFYDLNAKVTHRIYPMTLHNISPLLNIRIGAFIVELRTPFDNRRERVVVIK